MSDTTTTQRTDRRVFAFVEFYVSADEYDDDTDGFLFDTFPSCTAAVAAFPTVGIHGLTRYTILDGDRERYDTVLAEWTSRRGWSFPESDAS